MCLSLSIPLRRRPHPNSADHEVVEWDTKVHHQLCVQKGLSGADVMKEIVKYLKGYDVELPDGTKERVKGYEDIYPETIDPAIDEVVRKLREAVK
jgi:hypothetical protein